MGGWTVPAEGCRVALGSVHAQNVTEYQCRKMDSIQSKLHGSIKHGVTSMAITEGVSGSVNQGFKGLGVHVPVSFYVATVHCERVLQFRNSIFSFFSVHFHCASPGPTLRKWREELRRATDD